jgi:hypothetical protein
MSGVISSGLFSQGGNYFRKVSLFEAFGEEVVNVHNAMVSQSIVLDSGDYSYFGHEDFLLPEYFLQFDGDFQPIHFWHIVIHDD